MATQERKLMRLPEQGQIFGVCAGLANYFEVDATLVRVLFIILAVATGGGMVIAYIILAIVMPERKTLAVKSKTVAAEASGGSTLGQNVADLKGEIQQSERAHRARNYIGIGLVALGIWLLAVQFLPAWFNFRWDYIWPVIIVLIGIGMISRNRR